MTEQDGGCRCCSDRRRRGRRARPRRRLTHPIFHLCNPELNGFCRTKWKFRCDKRRREVQPRPRAQPLITFSSHSLRFSDPTRVSDKGRRRWKRYRSAGSSEFFSGAQCQQVFENVRRLKGFVLHFYRVWFSSGGIVSKRNLKRDEFRDP